MKKLEFKVKNMEEDKDLTEEELIKKYNINIEDFERFKFSCLVDSVLYEEDEETED